MPAECRRGATAAWARVPESPLACLYEAPTSVQGALAGGGDEIGFRLARRRYRSYLAIVRL